MTDHPERPEITPDEQREFDMKAQATYLLRCMILQLFLGTAETWEPGLLEAAMVLRKKLDDEYAPVRERLFNQESH